MTTSRKVTSERALEKSWVAVLKLAEQHPDEWEGQDLEGEVSRLALTDRARFLACQFAIQTSAWMAIARLINPEDADGTAFTSKRSR